MSKITIRSTKSTEIDFDLSDLNLPDNWQELDQDDRDQVVRDQLHDEIFDQLSQEDEEANIDICWQESIGTFSTTAGLNNSPTSR